MSRLTRHWPWILLLVAALLLLCACEFDDSAPDAGTCVEIDVDHPKSKHPKTSKPRTVKPKAPAYRAPSTSKRR